MRSQVEFGTHISEVFESTRDMAMDGAIDNEIIAKAEISMLELLMKCDIDDSIIEIWNSALTNLDPNLDRISWLRQTGLKRAMRWVTEGGKLIIR